MEALKASQKLLGGPMGADLVAIGLSAGGPGDQVVRTFLRIKRSSMSGVMELVLI